MVWVAPFELVLALYACFRSLMAILNFTELADVNIFGIIKRFASQWPLSTVQLGPPLERFNPKGGGASTLATFWTAPEPGTQHHDF